MHNFDPQKPQHDMMFRPQDNYFQHYEKFLASNLRHDPAVLTQKVENHFNRITLVNKQKTERLTIDFDLIFDNICNGQHMEMDNIVIIELKRDGRQPSPILRHLMTLGIKPMRFSKYVIGYALTNNTLRRNRIKPRLRKITKLMTQ